MYKKASKVVKNFPLFIIINAYNYQENGMNPGEFFEKRYDPIYNYNVCAANFKVLHR